MAGPPSALGTTPVLMITLLRESYDDPAKDDAHRVVPENSMATEL